MYCVHRSCKVVGYCRHILEKKHLQRSKGYKNRNKSNIIFLNGLKRLFAATKLELFNKFIVNYVFIGQVVIEYFRYFTKKVLMPFMYYRSYLNNRNYVEIKHMTVNYDIKKFETQDHSLRCKEFISGS